MVILAPRRGPSLNAGAPYYIAHRGNAMMYPEDTLEAYLASLKAGSGRLLEQDTRLTSTGNLAIIHDADVATVTTSSGDISTFTTLQWMGLTMDPQTWLGGNIEAHPSIFENVVPILKGKTIFVPEARSLEGAERIVATLQANRIPPDQAIVQSFTLEHLLPVVAAGYQAMLLNSYGAGRVSEALSAGITWAGTSNADTDAHISEWISAGFKTVVYTVTRRWERDHYLGLGAVGFFSDDVKYLSAAGPQASRDNYAGGTWMTGMLARSNGMDETSRGRFFAPNWWGWDATSTTQDYVLQGWACPVGGNAAINDYSVSFTARFGGVRATDTEWIAFLMNDASRLDAGFGGGSGDPADKFYMMRCRKNGQMLIDRYDGQSSTTLAAASSVAIADGEDVSFRARISPTSVRLSRLNPDGSDAYVVEASDTTYRGGYFLIGRYALKALFRDMMVN